MPDDYVENPRVLDAIRDPDYYDFARELNRLWLVLGRKMIDDVAVNLISNNVPEMFLN